ncbi:MAG TPA: D-alanyl-D-alanine carboxypeptidase/D-alanyl-D-alanine-endopeptidase [Blastocatellia bacterium]|nr:D-alanyl-D-alanine carboxypeptidase/D-alanyl-D-alanine-endopeptidase [Blastocatellia bacterium]
MAKSNLKFQLQSNRRAAAGLVWRVALLLCSIAVISALATAGLTASNPEIGPDTSAFSQEIKPKAGTPLKPEDLDSLRLELLSVIAEPRFARAAWGVEAVSLDTGKVIFQYDAGKYFTPASNAKLFAAALALDTLGADFRIGTSFYSPSAPDGSGRIRGDVVVYGRGDPAFAMSNDSTDYYSPLEPLAAVLEKAGVRRIDGDLVGDESYFRGAPFGRGWEWEDFQWYYGAEASALSLNGNAIELRIEPGRRQGLPCQVTTDPDTALVTLVNSTSTSLPNAPRRLSVYRPPGENTVYVSGSMPLGDIPYTGYVAVHNPALLFVTSLKEVLRRHGITVKGKVRAVDSKSSRSGLDVARLKCLGTVYSKPLSEIVKDTLKRSQNLYAQLLFLQVGANAEREMMPIPGQERSGPATAAKGPPAPLAGPPQAGQPDKPVDQRPQTTEEASAMAMQLFLAKVGAKVGLDAGSASIVEGSGLSRQNLVTPDSVVKLLVFISRQNWAPVFMDSLPVAGLDGTLKNRMKATPAAGNLRAKTGTLLYDNALSGYLTTRVGEHFAFSIVVNNYINVDGAHPVNRDIDKIAETLAGFGGHS